MRKPREPHNPIFWNYVINNPNLCESFKEKGNTIQLSELKRAVKFNKWYNIRQSEV